MRARLRHKVPHTSLYVVLFLSCCEAFPHFVLHGDPCLIRFNCLMAFTHWRLKQAKTSPFPIRSQPRPEVDVDRLLVRVSLQAGLAQLAANAGLLDSAEWDPACPTSVGISTARETLTVRKKRTHRGSESLLLLTHTMPASSLLANLCARTMSLVNSALPNP